MEEIVYMFSPTFLCLLSLSCRISSVTISGLFLSFWTRCLASLSQASSWSWLMSLFPFKDANANRVLDEWFFQEEGDAVGVALQPSRTWLFLQLQPQLSSFGSPKRWLVRECNMPSAQEGPQINLARYIRKHFGLTFAVLVSPNKEIFTCICLFNTSALSQFWKITDLWLSLSGGCHPA